MEETGFSKALNGTLVWGTFDCQEINCFEILFYIVASLTFLILVSEIFFNYDLHLRNYKVYLNL